MKNNNGIYSFELNDSAEKFDEIFEYNLAKINNNEKVNEIYSARNTLLDYIKFLKKMKIVNNNGGRAFDFVISLSLCGTICETINLLLINLFPDKVKNKKSIHPSLLDVQNGKECFCKTEYTDYEYFEYIRSLCSVHPTNTDRSTRGRDRDKGKNVLFNIMWGTHQTDGINDIYINLARGNDLSRLDDGNNKIRINEFEKFLNKYITLIDIAGNQINAMCIEPKRIESIDTFDGNYDAYLSNLQKECVERSMNYTFYGDKGFRKYDPTPYDFYRIMLHTNVSNSKNDKLCSLYKNAIKYAFSKEHFRLENFNDYTEKATGINYAFEIKENFTLLDILKFRLLDLYNINNNLLLFTVDILKDIYDKEDIDERFNLLKSASIEENENIRKRLRTKNEFFSKYLEITWEESNEELVLLCNTAIYLYEMSKSCSILSINMPCDDVSYDNIKEIE